MAMDLESVLSQLRLEGRDWAVSATQIIALIPSGTLASYGSIADKTNDRFGSEIQARNIGWLRRHLYELTNRDSTLPLHRIACQGDVFCERDSERTREESIPLRRKEGALNNTKWWDGTAT